MTGKAIPAFLIAYSDSGFTNPHEVVLPDEPKDCTRDFTHIGKKYWGFETGRHKATTMFADEQAFAYDHDTHNWLRIGLKERSEISKITISTKWYTGNQVRAVSVYLIDELSGQEKQILDRAPLKPDAEHEFPVSPTLATECRVDCYYEGGISRINLFGERAREQLPNRVNLLEGAAISHISNDHYGNPAMAVKGERKEMHMVGWESARTGFGERAVFHLKAPAEIGEIVVDTYLHRLNPPLSCHVFALHEKDGRKIDDLMKQAPRWKLTFNNGKEAIPDDFQTYMLEQQYLKEKQKSFKIKLHIPANCPWQPLLPFAPLTADTFHRFRALEPRGKATHVLYMHYPNGGVHGLKMYERRD
jgi:allantoicase